MTIVYLYFIVIVLIGVVIGIASLRLMFKNMIEINKLNNPKTILKDLHPELENVQPGDELMTVNFGEEKGDEDPLYKSLKNRIDELNDELDDEDEDEDDDGGDVVVRI